MLLWGEPGRGIQRNILDIIIHLSIERWEKDFLILWDAGFIFWRVYLFIYLLASYHCTKGTLWYLQKCLLYILVIFGSKSLYTDDLLMEEECRASRNFFLSENSDILIFSNVYIHKGFDT
jgi:hypothetical protein